MNILNKKIIKRYDIKEFKFYELFIKHLQKYQIKYYSEPKNYESLVIILFDIATIIKQQIKKVPP